MPKISYGMVVLIVWFFTLALFAWGMQVFSDRGDDLKRISVSFDSLLGISPIVDTVLITDTLYQSLSYPVPIWTINQYGQSMEGVFISFYDSAGHRRVIVVSDRRGQALSYLPLGQCRIEAEIRGRVFRDTTIIVKQSVNPIILIGPQIDGGIH